MKQTGIIRRVDDLGRVVIPKEIRRTLHIHDGDPLEICLTEDGVLFQPYDVKKDINNVCNDLRDAMQDLDYDFRRGLLEKLDEIQTSVKKYQRGEK